MTEEQVHFESVRVSDGFGYVQPNGQMLVSPSARMNITPYEFSLCNVDELVVAVIVHKLPRGMTPMSSAADEVVTVDDIPHAEQNRGYIHATTTGRVRAPVAAAATAVVVYNYGLLELGSHPVVIATTINGAPFEVTMRFDDEVEAWTVSVDPK